MDGFNTFEKQDKVLLGLNSGNDAAAAYRILQQQGFAVLTFTAEEATAPAQLLPRSPARRQNDLPFESNHCMQKAGMPQRACLLLC